MRPGPEQRFLSKVQFGPGCWEWVGGRHWNGYGAFRLGDTNRAHRVAYRLYVGPIPAGYQIDHLCRNRRCVRPDHLEAVTQQENIRRGCVGENNRSKTECPSGHPYTTTNTRMHTGRRYCRACDRARTKETT